MPFHTRNFRKNKIKSESLDSSELLLEHLEHVTQALGENESETTLRLRLAVTDVFVEKAQYHLTQRGVLSYILAILFMMLTAAIAWAFLIYIGPTNLTSDRINALNSLNNNGLILAIIQKLVSGTVFLAGIYLSASFARAFLHEGTILFSRRHALRFGRLYVYLSDGKLTGEDLREAFGWNFSPSTAFTRVKPEQVTRGLVGQVGDAFEKAAKAAQAGKSRQ